MRDDLGMTDRIAAVFIHLGIQASETVVQDVFVALGVSVELVGVGTSTDESASWIELLVVWCVFRKAWTAQTVARRHVATPFSD